MSTSHAVSARPVPPRASRAGAGRQEPLATRLRMSLLRTARRLRDERAGDLPDSQMAVLGYLVAHASATPGELAERERVKPPSMTRTVQHLVDAGLVVREPHPDDRRQILVSLSDSGREFVQATRRRRDEWLQRRLGALTADERATLAAAEAILRRIHTE
jgi:DNA-binding MarR family transcriptional regulator